MGIAPFIASVLKMMRNYVNNMIRCLVHVLTDGNFPIHSHIDTSPANEMTGLSQKAW